MKIPPYHADLLEDSARADAYLATTISDGSPQVTPVWFTTEGEDFVVNTTRERIKDSNMRVRPQVALVAADARDAMRRRQIRGQIVAFTEQQGLAHVGTLSMKYRGRPRTPVDGQVRVIFRIRPERITVS